MLTLKEYLAVRRLTQTAFAARLARRLKAPVPLQSMSRWAREPGADGYSVPSPEIVAAIHRETRGQVTPDSWYGHLLPQLRKAVGQ